MAPRRSFPAQTYLRCLVQVYLLLQTIDFTVFAEGTSTPDVASGHRVSLHHEEVDLVPKYENTRKQKLSIYQHEPIKIGHVQHLELEPGKTYEMTTMALNPPVFVIPNFLTDEECERIKSLASETGLETSTTRRTQNKTNSSATDETFAEFDADSDDRLNATEGQTFMLSRYNLSLSTDELQFIFTHTGVQQDSDGLLDEAEFLRIPNVRGFIFRLVTGLRMRPMPMELLKKLRKGESRKSATVRLDHELYDPEEKLRTRIAALTRIHPDIVYSSERLHVVHYNSSGHYHGHTDSHSTDHNSIESVCEHTASLYPNQSNGEPPKTRLCRYMTVLYYLNEPEQGGQTAFPMADNDTYTQEGIDYEFRNKHRDVFDLTNHCTDSNLVVEAKKGMAVMWYNHYIEDDWIGELNHYSVHGGCEVIKGEKWIANHWVNVDHNYDMQMAYIADRIRQAPSSQDEEFLDHQQTIFNNSASSKATCKLTSDWNYSASITSHDEL